MEARNRLKMLKIVELGDKNATSSQRGDAVMIDKYSELASEIAPFSDMVKF